MYCSHSVKCLACDSTTDRVARELPSPLFLCLLSHNKWQRVCSARGLALKMDVMANCLEIIVQVAPILHPAGQCPLSHFAVGGARQKQMSSEIEAMISKSRLAAKHPFHITLLSDRLFTVARHTILSWSLRQPLWLQNFLPFSLQDSRNLGPILYSLHL